MSARSPVPATDEALRNEGPTDRWLASRRMGIPDIAFALRSVANGMDAADLGQDAVRRRAVSARVVAASSDSTELYAAPVTQQRCRPGVPDLHAQQPLGLISDDSDRCHHRRAGSLCLLALSVSRAGDAVLRGVAAEHVPGRRVPDPAVHHDAHVAVGEYRVVIDPHLPDLRVAAIDLAVE